MKDPEKVKKLTEESQKRNFVDSNVDRLTKFHLTQETKNEDLELLTSIKRTDKQRKRMSDNAKKLWKDPKYREKVIAAHKLYKPTQETKDKQSKSTKGRTVSLEVREKMSKAKMGHVVSEETKKKQSKSKLEKYSSGKLDHVKEKNRLALLGKKPWNKNLVYTQTEKAKVSVAKGKEKAWSNRQYKTVPELKAEEIFKRYNINYIIQKRIITKLYDFYLPDYNLLIEVDGTYWHGKSKLIEQLSGKRLGDRNNDIYKNNLAIERGYTLIRIWEDELWKLECLVKNNFIEIEDLHIDEENYDKYLKIA